MSNGTGSDPADILKSAREKLSGDERKIVKRIITAYELDLIEALPEIIAGVRASGKQSSFTETVTLKPAKKSNLHVALAPRVRAARSGTEFEAHIDDSNQLALGWVDVEDEDDETPEGAPAIGKGKAVGFDDDDARDAFKN